MKIPVQFLGQSGWKMMFPGAVIYVDPYLSNSVEELDAPDLKRLKAIPFKPDEVIDADYILITHDHMDHCDPYTLPIIANSSPSAKFVGPQPVIDKLIKWGIAPERVVLSREDWMSLSDGGLKICAIPAAHLTIERDSSGNLLFVGYIIQYAGKNIYIAGDTCVDEGVINCVKSFSPIHTAILPVNEHNYYRAKRGIVGNMSIREAFQFAEDINAKNVIPVHWDLFEINAAYPEEIKLIYEKNNHSFRLSIDPKFINITGADVSVVIRTLNESKYLNELLSSIKAQKLGQLSVEIVLVDSGSEDGTIEIAERHGCRILHITREEFSFGRSLNMGCAAAEGEILVITSGHCVPIDNHWLQRLCQPIWDGVAQYTYGRQYGDEFSHFSECRIFAKYFPENSRVPQEGFFCNNANAALDRATWYERHFDEELTGLEDMELAQSLVKRGGKVAYVADAGVYHHHMESWFQVRRRFEREAIALQKIMPQLHVRLSDTVRYILTSVLKDMRALRRTPHSNASLKNIFLYRWNQYIGSWRGNQHHRRLSHIEKDQYFYPH